MANTLSTTKMTNPIRGLVSKRRIRYTQDGFDLDLTYINDRIIAMGYPAEHMESIYRNKIEDVHKMLEKNHAGCYKIYNLCSERSYNHNRFPCISVYPFKDHNPPDIELIVAFCRDVDQHLRADSKNVVAVHCKAGKGRTGTMICCYLLYSRQFNTADEALHYYAQRRTSDSKGVTIPSQRRYVEYYASLLKSNETYQPVPLYICEIRLTGNSLNIKEATINAKGEAPQSVPEFKRTDDGGGVGGGVGGGGGGGVGAVVGGGGNGLSGITVAKLDYCKPLAGDIKIEFVKSSVLRKEKRCHFWFNTYFVEKSARRDSEGNLLLAFSKTEIDDAHKDKHHKEYPNNFMVEVVLRRVPPGKYSENVSLKTTTSPLTRCSLENNRQQLHHPAVPQQQQQTALFQPQQQQQQFQHPPHHRQDPYRPAIINQSNNYIVDGTANNRPLVSGGGGYQHDQHHHLHQQHSAAPTSADIAQQQQQFQQPVHDGNNHNNQQHQQNVDETNHYSEYFGTSSSESSTEEEGWDSGECPTPLLLPPEKASLYYRNDNYYYGSCAGLSAGGSDPTSGPAPPPPPPRLPSINSNDTTTTTTTSSSNNNNNNNNSCSSKTDPEVVHVLHDASSSSPSRPSNNNTIGSSKLNQSLANTTPFAASASSSSGKRSSVVPASASTSSSGSVSHSLQNSLPSPPPPSVTKRQPANSASSNGKLVSSAGLPLTTAAKTAASAVAGGSSSPSSTSATTNTSAWPSLGLKRKKKKSFKSGSARNFARTTREFGSNISSACSAGPSTPSSSSTAGGSSQSGKSKSSGKGRFNTFRWLRTMRRGDLSLKKVLATSGDIMTLTNSTNGSGRPDPVIPSTPPPTPTVATIPQNTGALMLPVAAWLPPCSSASSENLLLSTDYYSSICDKQLSFESPSKSPGHLMKLNLTRAPPQQFPAIPDSECAIVVAAKPSERRPKIGFDVSPTASPTAKTAVDPDLDPFVVVVVQQPSVDISVCDSGTSSSEVEVKSLSLAPKSENASFCDRILQTLVSGLGGASRKPSDQDLRFPQPQLPPPPPPAIEGAAAAVAVESKVKRCSSFSLRELGQELKSVIKSSSSSGGGSPNSSISSSTSSIQQPQQQPQPKPSAANGNPPVPHRNAD